MIVGLKRFWLDKNIKRPINQLVRETRVCPLYCCLFRDAFPSLNFKHHPGDTGPQLEFLIWLDRDTTVSPNRPLEGLLSQVEQKPSEQNDGPF